MYRRMPDVLTPAPLPAAAPAPAASPSAAATPPVPGKALIEIKSEDTKIITTADQLLDDMIDNILAHRDEPSLIVGLTPQLFRVVGAEGDGRVLGEEGLNDFLVINVERSLGLGILHNGELFRGANGLSPDLGDFMLRAPSDGSATNASSQSVKYESVSG